MNGNRNDLRLIKGLNAQVSEALSQASHPATRIAFAAMLKDLELAQDAVNREFAILGQDSGEFLELVQ